MTLARLKIKEACYQMRAFLEHEKAEAKRYSRRHHADDGKKYTVLIAYTKDGRQACVSVAKPTTL